MPNHASHSDDYTLRLRLHSVAANDGWRYAQNYIVAKDHDHEYYSTRDECPRGIPTISR